MAEVTREDRQAVAQMDLEETKAAVEGADNAIARRLRALQMTRRAPPPVTPAESQNTPIALALKACEERDEVVAARDAVTRERDRLARELEAVSAERDAAVAGRDAAIAAGSAAIASTVELEAAAAKKKKRKQRARPSPLKSRAELEVAAAKEKGATLSPSTEKGSRRRRAADEDATASDDSSGIEDEMAPRTP